MVLVSARRTYQLTRAWPVPGCTPQAATQAKYTGRTTSTAMASMKNLKRQRAERGQRMSKGYKGGGWGGCLEDERPLGRAPPPQSLCC